MEHGEETKNSEDETMIQVKDSAEFSLLLEALAQDIVDANIQYRLYADLDEAFKNHPEVWHQARAFWSLTTQALLDACQFALCRAYDNHGRALHLNNWLAAIQENLHFFDEADFRERQKNNPYLESLAAEARKPDEKELAADLLSTSNDDPLVKLLTVHRGSRLAHRSAKNVVNKHDINSTHPLEFQDLEALLERALTLLNKYAGLFAATAYSTQVVGHDDYTNIFSAVLKDINAQKAEWEIALKT
jgi:hypothetical protein